LGADEKIHEVARRAIVIDLDRISMVGDKARVKDRLLKCIGQVWQQSLWQG
jgi:hypothetical protein